MYGIERIIYVFSIIGLRCADTAQKHGRARNMDTLYSEQVDGDRQETRKPIG
jgi:hypothetical protein